MADSYVAPPVVKTEYFTQPRIHYAEIVVAGTPVDVTAGPPGVWVPGNGGPISYVNQEVYKVSRPTLIDYIWMSEETLTVNGARPSAIPAPAPGPSMTLIDPGASGSFLNGLRVNWWVTDRPRAALRLRSPFEYNNYADRDATATVVAAFGSVDPSLTWKFRRPWVYKPGNSVVADWSYVTGEWTFPGGGQPPNFPPLRLILYGVGLRTRHRRIFEFEIPAMAPPVMPAPVPAIPQIWELSSNGSFATHEFISQQSDEPYEIDGLTFQYVTRDPITGEVTAAPPSDARMLNMLRVRVAPSQSEPISDDPVPVLAYGVDMGPPGRSAWYQPTGGPILLQPGQSIGWEVQSFLPPHGQLPLPINLYQQTNSRFQVALIGRTAPREVML
jgi:hypothetical protein